MRLLIAATAAVLMCSAAIAAPSSMMGSQTMMGAAKTAGVGTMIVHHQVADYAKWRVAYDADEPGRTAGGLVNCRVQRSLDNANDVVVTCNMTDIAKARAFASSKKLMDTMTKAGVMGKPQILFLTPPQ